MTHKIVPIFFVLLGVGFVHAQTSAELRARYGEPQMTVLKHKRPAVERFLVRPDILMTIRYTDRGEPCEAILKPVPNSTPKDRRPEDSINPDSMSTAEAIKLINELLPAEKRGKSIFSYHMNGGDPEMYINYFGCMGIDYDEFESASVMSRSWCGGGTFSVTIHWSKTSCPGQTLIVRKVKKARPKRSLQAGIGFAGGSGFGA